jgi:hypothetical protein
MKKIIMLMLSLCMLFSTSPLMSEDGTAEKTDSSRLSKQKKRIIY